VIRLKVPDRAARLRLLSGGAVFYSQVPLALSAPDSLWAPLC
jgi:hypothetical protein